MNKGEISNAARAMAMKRHASLSPERRKEIAAIAGRASVKARALKKSIVLSEHPSLKDR